MKVLVTGVAGFVGSHVLDSLRSRGHDVAGLDMRQGRDGQVDLPVDLMDQEALVRSLEGFGAVCHLAAVGDVYLAMSDPPLTAAVNVGGTANLLAWISQIRVK